MFSDWIFWMGLSRLDYYLLSLFDNYPSCLWHQIILFERLANPWKIIFIQRVTYCCEYLSLFVLCFASGLSIDCSDTPSNSPSWCIFTGLILRVIRDNHSFVLWLEWERCFSINIYHGHGLGLYPDHFTPTDHCIKIIRNRIYYVWTIFSCIFLSSFVRNINHRLRGYSNPDDVMDLHSRHFHHFYGGVDSFPSNISPQDRFHNESFCHRFCSFFSFSKATSSEIEGDSQTRLVVSSRQPRDQRQPPQGKIPDDPFFHRFDFPDCSGF